MAVQNWQHKSGSDGREGETYNVRRFEDKVCLVRLSNLSFILEGHPRYFYRQQGEKSIPKPIMDWLAIWPGLKIKVFEGFTFHVGNEVGGHCDSMNDHRKEHNRINFQHYVLGNIGTVS